MKIQQLSFLAFLLVLSILFSNRIDAQQGQSYIYGKVTTHSGEEYVGFMRWGTEELFWHDIFNSEKLKTDEYKVQKKKTENSRWLDFKWNWSSVWEDKYSTTPHTFACFFGDIKTIHIQDGAKVDLELKNGSVIHLNGGSNDIGTSIKMIDYELGLISFKWSKIQKIDFLGASSKVELPYAPTIYGTVQTKRNGAFTGYIKWDLDERTLDGILDGNSNNGEQKIPFKNIKSIEKENNGARVILNSGRDIFLSGSNDVNNGNRGIAIYDDNIGGVEIPWNDFQMVIFSSAPQKGVDYDDFSIPKGLKGQVHTHNGLSYEGMLVFDIDEMWETEFLDGKDDQIQYQIPFRNISKVSPKNRSFSLIELSNGNQLLLGDTQDVSEKNDGVLVFDKSQKDPHYIAWDDIDIILINE